MVDEDSRELKLFKEPSLSSHDLKLGTHVLTIGVREFEDTFTDQQWADCANREWPRSDERAWDISDFKQHRDSKFSGKIERMVRENSTVEVSGKPEIMTTLALGLSKVEDVPEKLRAMFAELIERAAH